MLILPGPWAPPDTAEYCIIHTMIAGEDDDESSDDEVIDLSASACSPAVDLTLSIIARTVTDLIFQQVNMYNYCK